MKIAFRRAPVLAALDRVVKVTPASKAVPILSHTLLAARSDDGAGVAWLSGTDLASYIRVEVRGLAVREPGDVLLDAVEFSHYLRSTPADSNVVLVSEPNGVTARVDNWVTYFKTPAIENWPTHTDLVAETWHTFDRAALADALALVKPAAAGPSLSPKLQQVSIRDGKITAADGIRFHQVDIPDAAHCNFALPLPFCDDLVSVLRASTAPTVDLCSAAPSNVLLRADNLTLGTHIRRDTYPDLSQTFLIPALSHDQNLTISHSLLVDAIRRVRLVADTDTQAVRLTLAGSQSATISTQRRNGAWSRGTLPVTYDGTDRTLIFNHAHLLALLALFTPDDDLLTLRLGPDAKHHPSPVLIQHGNASGVLHQLRLDWT